MEIKLQFLLVKMSKDYFSLTIIFILSSFFAFYNIFNDNDLYLLFTEMTICFCHINDKNLVCLLLNRIFWLILKLNLKTVFLVCN